MAHFLICYDIASPSRLRKVAKILEDFGQRLQDSVFEVELNDNELDTLEKRLRKVIDPSLDGIKIFPMCGNCRNGRLSAGLARTYEEAPEWSVL